MKFVIFLLIIVSGLLSAHAQSEPNANTATDTTSVNELMEVVVVANPVTKVRNSAFNATAINTSDLVNTTRTLSETLNSAPRHENPRERRCGLGYGRNDGRLQRPPCEGVHRRRATGRRW